MFEEKKEQMRPYFMWKIRVLQSSQSNSAYFLWVCDGEICWSNNIQASSSKEAEQSENSAHASSAAGLLALTGLRFAQHALSHCGPPATPVWVVI